MEKEKPAENAIIILAAGNSSRLGFPKQNVQFQGKTLLERTVLEAKKVCKNIILVLGAQDFADFANDDKITVVQNKNWQSGMGSSVKTGITHLYKNHSPVQNIIISVCDQPFISSQIFAALILKKKKSNKNIVACKYQNIFGVPVLFDTKYLQELLQLEDGEGAKTLLQKFGTDIDCIVFEKGYIDIDTLQDVENLMQMHETAAKQKLLFK